MSARHASSSLQALIVDPSFEGEVRFDEPLARHTTYRIGGPAKAFVEVNDVTSLTRTINAATEDGLSWFVLGRGSNLLVSDDGYDGVILYLSGGFRDFSVDEDAARIVVGGGASLSRIVQEAFHHSLTGLEFAVGTPGTIGGGLRMNAGTSFKGLGDVTESVTTFSPDKGLTRYAHDDIEWSYRSTSFSPDEVILECVLALDKGETGLIRASMEGSLSRRRASQPPLPSCGSVFRNPENGSAGALIEQAGLKGKRVGGACISDVHANFIVNEGSATAHDVKTLIDMAKKEVKERNGIELKTEVKFLGFPSEDD